MERDNRDEDMMLKGTKQEMPGFYFRLLRSEEKRELWNPDFELLFLLRGTGRVSYEDGEVHNLPMDLSLRSTGFRSVTWIWTKTDLLCRSAFQRRRLIHFTLSC